MQSLPCVRVRSAHICFAIECGAVSVGITGRDQSLQSLERGIAVIQIFSSERPSLTLSEVARLTGITRATARRILLTLEKLGYVRSDERLFSLTPRVLTLGWAYLSSLNLWEIAQPFMEQLVEKTEESCSAATLDLPEVVYVARVPTRRIMAISLSVGSRLPGPRDVDGARPARRPPRRRARELSRERASRAIHRPDDHRCNGAPGRARRTFGRRAGRSWTRSSRSAYARSLLLSPAIRAARSQPSTCRPPRPGSRSTSSTSGCDRRSSRRRA